MGKAKHYIAVTVLIILSTLGLRGMLFYLYRLPDAASAQAGPIDTMFDVHFWLISFLFALIMVFMLYSVVIFRRKEGDDEPGRHVHGHTALEIIWTVVPVVVVIGFGIWGVSVLNALTAEQDDEMTINVYGKQWSWTFQYPEEDNVTTRNLLVMPVNQNILLEMESEDVLHSFWIPEFRVKQDLVPATKTYLRITPTKEDEYTVRCAEICGFDHSRMLADVRVVSQADFDDWIEERQNAPAYADMTPEERGEIWHTELGCVDCHSLDGEEKSGPTWLSLYGREEALTGGATVIVDDAYIHDSILDPNKQIVAGFDSGLMPDSYGEQFDVKQAEILASEGLELDIIVDLIAFMQTLEE